MTPKHITFLLIGALILLLGSLPLIYQYGLKQGTYLEETNNLLIPTDLEEQATLCLEEDRRDCESGLAVGLECQYSVIRYCSFLARAIMEDEGLYLAHPYPYTEENFTVVPDIIIRHYKEQPGSYVVAVKSHDQKNSILKQEIGPFKFAVMDGSNDSNKISSFSIAKNSIRRISQRIFYKG